MVKLIFLIFCSVAVFAGPAWSAREDVRHTPVVKVIKDCVPSVVNISTERTVLLQANPYWRRFGGIFPDAGMEAVGRPVGAMKLTGLGSGVIVSKDGLIVTNAHVINMATKIYAVLYDGSTHEATVVATNPKNDVALVKIDSSDVLQPIGFADDVILGETVVSIGNPFGLGHSVSSGIVSGLNRKFYDKRTQQAVFDGLIQTDASINMGNSGGALINLEGKLIGIDLAVLQNAQNVSFAIPASRIKGIIEEYKTYKQRNNIKVQVQ